jgi:hypothetical protein
MQSESDMLRPVKRSNGDSNARINVLGLSSLLFVMACAMPALVIRDGERVDSWEGWFLLTFGWGGLFQAQFAWLANLLLVGAALLVWRRRYVGAAVTSGMALPLALDTAAMFSQPVAIGDEVRPCFLQRFGPGFFLWLASFLVVLGGACWLVRRRRREG